MCLAFVEHALLDGSSGDGGWWVSIIGDVHGIVQGDVHGIVQGDVHGIARAAWIKSNSPV